MSRSTHLGKDKNHVFCLTLFCRILSMPRGYICRGLESNKRNELNPRFGARVGTGRQKILSKCLLSLLTLQFEPILYTSEAADFRANSLINRSKVIAVLRILFLDNNAQSMQSGRYKWSGPYQALSKLWNN